MPLSFFMRTLIIFCLTISLQFLPLINVFKVIALFFLLLYLYELFFNPCFLDLIEGGIIYKKQLYPFVFSKINIKKFGLFKLLMVRLNNKIFLLFGDVESRYDLINKYMKHYTPGGVKNW